MREIEQIPGSIISWTITALVFLGFAYVGLQALLLFEAASLPNLNGQSQKRIITSLTADELKYTNPASTTGTVAEAVWRRAK